MTQALPAPRRRGFTLIEIMLAIAILVLLMGGLLGTVRGTVRAAATLRDAQQTRNTVDGLFQLCQQTFPALPASASLTWNDRGEGKPLPEVVLRNAPIAFAVGTTDFFLGEISFATRRQNNGGTALGIEYRGIDPQTNQIRPNPLWLLLAKDLQEVAWSFFDPQTGKWQQQWPNPNQHPALIRLSLTFLGDSRTWTQTFWLPKLIPPQNAATTPNPTSTP